MHILWLHQYFATPSGWGSVRTYEFGRRFVAAGHKVEVLCCAAYDPTLVGKGILDAAGMRVHVSSTRYRPQMGFLARIGSFLSFAGFAVWHVLRHGRKYDLIIASSGPLTMALPALLARWLHKTPFVFEVIDVWPDAAIESGVLRNRLLQGAAFRLEACAYRHASRIVTCSTGMTERIVRKGAHRATGWRSHNAYRATGWRSHNSHRAIGGVSHCAHANAYADKIATISNCCDLEIFQPDTARRRAARAALGLREDQFVILYTGAMGRSNAIDDLVQAANQTAGDARWVWCFAGDGPEADKLRQLPGSRFFGMLSREQLIDLYQAADVAVVTFLHAPLFEENSPNKFFDAIAAGLPVVFNRSTWLEADLAAYGCGFVCTGEIPGNEMAAQLQRLASDPVLRQRMGAGARRLAEERFSRDQLADRYLEVVDCSTLAGAAYAGASSAPHSSEDLPAGLR